VGKGRESSERGGGREGDNPSILPARALLWGKKKKKREKRGKPKRGRKEGSVTRLLRILSCFEQVLQAEKRRERKEGGK